MSPLFEAAKEIHAFFRRKRWPFCIIGGIAVLRWGEQRATTDVDLTLLVELGRERELIDAILSRFRARGQDAREFALASRVVLCEASNGTEIDIALGSLPYERRAVARASSHRFGTRMNWITVSAEDLVIQKAFAGRDHDWLDVKGILRRQMPRLDWELITGELEHLLDLKEEWSSMERLQKMRRQVELELRE